MNRMATFLVATAVLLAASGDPVAAAVPGYVVPASTGEIVRCDAHQTLTIKLRSSQTIAGLMAGVGSVRGTAQHRAHPDAEESIYVTSGWGQASIGSRRIPLAPGSILYIPPGTSRQLVSSANAPLEYLFVLNNPAASPCGSVAASRDVQITSLEPDAGERITYCLFPLTITAKIDKESVPASSLTLAAGELRSGKEYATHNTSDEIVFITRGTAQAIVGERTEPVQPGSLVVTPRGNYHGFIHEGTDTLNYVIAFSGTTTRAAFRALANREGPFCPSLPVTAASRSGGYILEPSAGEPLIFCDTPDLRVNIKVSPQTTGDAPLVFGTAELHGANSGTHRDADEVIFFTAGSGSAFVGESKVMIKPGVTMYVPRGVRHGFTSDGAEPVTFVWTMAPPGFEKRFREAGHPPTFDCTAAKLQP